MSRRSWFHEVNYNATMALIDCIVSQINLVNTHRSYSSSSIFIMGARGSVVVKALCYKPEGNGFDTR
jgi:hypothetical protein